ncbi:hypothetical protein PBF_13669 [Cytobacillus firmus DS1]|uniref:Uncharacterized protein n=1 Tax=Cytobacillus firmus DS1 TaxID=1307436 RepID=W7L5R2_CYTFI|nr:hypothetical protein PBF_13669 [Cytobacillus firmus DS1]
MRDSCGSSGTGETPQTRSVDEAQRLPRGKRASWSGNQRATPIGENTPIYTKRAFLLNGWPILKKGK